MIIAIGAGPGDIGYLTRRAAALIEDADVIAGFETVVNIVRGLIPAAAEVVTMGYRDQDAQLARVAAAHHAGKRCVVVFMGDVHFSGFQYLERVERACGHEVETLPGISSAQVLASRARVCFDETTFITFHRRGDLAPFKRHLVSVLDDERNAIVIPCPWDAARSFMPRHIAAYLLERGVSPWHPTEVWESLTRDEARWSGTLAECVGREFSHMSIMLIRRQEERLMSDQIAARTREAPDVKTEEALDGTKTEYEYMDCGQQAQESLFKELFEIHWNHLRFGPCLPGAVFELVLTEKPRVSFLDGYLTVDAGPWHFHLCVGEYKGKTAHHPESKENLTEIARQRRVTKAAFFKTTDTAGSPQSWGLRFWNGRGEQMITVFLPNPFRGDDLRKLKEPDWSRLDLWKTLRKDYLGEGRES